MSGRGIARIDLWGNSRTAYAPTPLHYKERKKKTFITLKDRETLSFSLVVLIDIKCNTYIEIYIDGSMYIVM